MKDKINWGILSTARIGLKKVIPAMQKGKYSFVKAIASRTHSQAQKAAKKLKIPKTFGSYKDLLNDETIDAVYIPLPNHLHVEWTLKSLQAGKHVLCEKPIGLNLKEAEYLSNETAKYPRLRVMEAFMYRFHPQWQKTKELVESGVIGELKTIHSFFSYYNTDPQNIRNQADIGGGGLLDIGCYCVSLARFLFKSEPHHVSGYVEHDPEMKIDRLASGIMEFADGTATFTCGTQIIPYQRVHIFGTKGKIEIEIPFNPPDDRATTIVLRTGSKVKKIHFKKCNQYTIQGDLFSLSILNNTNVPTPLADSVANMKVIEDIIQSAANAKLLHKLQQA